jgi:hypothetical protein
MPENVHWNHVVVFACLTSGDYDCLPSASLPGTVHDLPSGFLSSTYFAQRLHLDDLQGTAVQAALRASTPEQETLISRLA